MVLPYGVKVLNTADGLNEICELDSIMTSRKHDKVFVGLTLPDDAIMICIEMVKPYLRPMLSMTKEELREYNHLYAERENNNEFDDIKQYSDLINWLLENHLDFIGLIPQGLAIEVTKDNNPYKN